MSEILGDIRMGRHSGLPWCCVTWFSVAWAPLGSRWWNWVHRNFPDNSDVEYIRCPLCRATGREVEIHFCTEVCG